MPWLLPPPSGVWAAVWFTVRIDRGLRLGQLTFLPLGGMAVNAAAGGDGLLLLGGHWCHLKGDSVLRLGGSTGDAVFSDTQKAVPTP